MLLCYTPEMGDKIPTENIVKTIQHLEVIKQQVVEMSASVGHYGGYFIDTKVHLKGQGIKLIRDHYINIRNERVLLNQYRVTDRAFEKLKQKYNIRMECLLD